MREGLDTAGPTEFGDLFLKRRIVIFLMKNYWKFIQNGTVMKKSYGSSWIKWNKILRFLGLLYIWKKFVIITDERGKRLLSGMVP